MELTIHELLTPYAADLRATFVAVQTIKRYTNLLRGFIAWADPTVAVGDMDGPLLTQYQISLGAAQLAARTVRLNLSALRSFSRWCMRQGYRADDPTLLLDWPSIPKTKPKALTGAELARLDDALATPLYRYSLRKWRRNTLAIYLMLYAGLRIGEACALRWEDLDLVYGVLRVVNGKGGKDRDIPLAEELWALLDETPIAEQVGPVIPSGWAVTDRKPLSVKGMAKIFDVWLPSIGVEGVHAHRLRHTCAHYMQVNGADVRDIQLVLGHESLDTTALYLGNDIERLRGAVNRLPPLRELGQRRERKPRLRMIAGNQNTRDEAGVG